MSMSRDQFDQAIDAASTNANTYVKGVYDKVVPPGEPDPPPIPTPVLKQYNEDNFTFSGVWNKGVYVGAFQGGDQYSSQAGATADVTFTGTRIVLIGTKDTHHGSATVFLDGTQTTISCKAASRQEQVLLWSADNLASGNHHLVVTVVGDGVVALDRLDTDGAPVAKPPPTPDPVPDPTPGPLPKLKRTGSIITDMAGKRVVPRGTNFYAVKAYPSGAPADGQMAPVNSYHLANRDRIASDCAKWGVNWVRLLINAETAIFPNIKAIADANAAHGIYTMICGFDNGGFGGFDAAGGQRRGAHLVNCWKACGSPDYITINLSNEPNGIDNGTWLAHSQAGVNAIRQGGYTGLIFLDGNGWAHVANVAEIKQINDPNLVLALHAYAFDGGSRQPGTQATQILNGWAAASNKSVCMITGEWGPFNEGQFGGNGDLKSAVDIWCEPFKNRFIQLVQSGDLAGGTNWMLIWDGNSQLDAVTPSPEGNTDWWGIVSTAPGNYKLNYWGAKAQQAWAALATITN